MVLLTIPVFFPIVTGLGFDPVWFGVLIVLVVQIGLISPPVGMNLFVHHLPRRVAVRAGADHHAGHPGGLPAAEPVAAVVHEVSGVRSGSPASFRRGLQVHHALRERDLDAVLRAALSGWLDVDRQSAH
jgi:hypothetical protein